MKPAAICPDDRPDIVQSECDVLDAASLLRRTKNQKRKFARMNGKMINTGLYHASRETFIGKNVYLLHLLFNLITFKEDIHSLHWVSHHRRDYSSDTFRKIGTHNTLHYANMDRKCFLQILENFSYRTPWPTLVFGFSERFIE